MPDGSGGGTPQSPARQLLQEIKAELNRDHREVGEAAQRLDAFKARFLALKAVNTPVAKLTKQAIYESLMDFSEKHHVDCFFTNGELACFGVRRRGLSRFQPGSIPKKEQLTPPRTPESEPQSPSKEEEAKKLFRQQFSMHFIHFRDELKGKLELAKHQKKALAMYEVICKQAKPLEKEPTEESFQAFKSWFQGFLQEEQEHFKDTPWIWYDVLRPLFMGFLGVISALVMVVVRPFFPEVAEHADSFFAERVSPAFKVIQDEANDLLDKIEALVPVSA